MLVYADNRWGSNGSLYRLMKFMFPVLAAYLATILRDLIRDPTRGAEMTMFIVMAVAVLLYLALCYINLLLESPRVAQRVSVDGDMVKVHYYSGTEAVFSLDDVTGVSRHDKSRFWISFLRGSAMSVGILNKRDVLVSAHLRGSGDVVDVLTRKLNSRQQAP